jgi:hypothetical protein
MPCGAVQLLSKEPTMAFFGDFKPLTFDKVTPF